MASMMNDVLGPAPGQAASGGDADGVVSRLLTQFLFRSAVVADNRELVPGLRLLTLEGPALRGLHWRPGDKLQVKIGGGMTTRTYTPIEWDAAQGRTRLFAHALAPGPGGVWARDARPGQLVRLFGPRKSLDLSRLDARTGMLVGDETVIGLAAAWRPAHALFEVNDRNAVQGVADWLGLPATVIARQSDDGHFDRMIDALLHAWDQDTGFVLAGRARTIQRLLRGLRENGVTPNRILTKAYWAEGKVGLD